MQFVLSWSSIAVVRGPYSYYTTKARIWGHLKRCDMLLGTKSPAHSATSGRFGFYAKTDYTEGAWVPASAARPSITDPDFTPLACAATRSACPLGSCSDDGAATSVASDVCAEAFQGCYGTTDGGKIVGRPSSFAQHFNGLAWVWQPAVSPPHPYPHPPTRRLLATCCKIV